MADHYAQNGTHAYLPFFSVTPKKSQAGNLRSKKKKCVTHQNINSAQNKNHNQRQYQEMQLLSSSHKNVYHHKVK
jgi:hypothetical protein